MTNLRIKIQRPKFGPFLHSDQSSPEDETSSNSSPSLCTTPNSETSSPYSMSPGTDQYSPIVHSPWTTTNLSSPAKHSTEYDSFHEYSYTCMPKHGLIGSLVREQGHIYSLAASGDLLYAGSDSKNIRVWKNLQGFSEFKCSSGLVKAIIVLGDKIFTGHQDGKIRVWRFSAHRKQGYKRVGSLPTTKDYFTKALNPNNYVEVRRNKNVPWLKHFDAVSCMCVDENQGLLYSGSWDKTIKVWRISDNKCLESIDAHEDTINSVVAVFGGLIFSGAADGTVKAWRRELVGNSTKHVLVETLMDQENAVTSLVVATSDTTSDATTVLYAGTSEGLVSFWERDKHFMVYGGVLRGHKMAVLCLGVVGSLLMSGSAEKSVCVWRRGEGGFHECVAVLAGHDGPVKCLAVAEAEEREEEAEKGERWWMVYSGSLDKSVKLWRVTEEYGAAELEAMA